MRRMVSGRVLVVSGALVAVLAGVTLVARAEPPASAAPADPAAACAEMMGGAATAEGRSEMQRFMESGRMGGAMSGMMAMARRMGGGDAMTGMVRMMEMMGSMGGGMRPGMMQPPAAGGRAPDGTPSR